MLSIRLTQPVVPLRTERTPRHRDSGALPPAIVRGLLTLKLTKPTKVSSIEVELQAKATTHYSQAAGRTRIEITEEYKAYSTSVVVFKAAPPQVQQRAASARPRVQFLGTTIAQHGSCRRRSGHWQSPGDLRPLSRSASLDPRSPRARQYLGSGEPETNGNRIPQQDQTRMDSAPPYPSQVDQRALPHIDFQGSPAAGSTGLSITGLRSSSVFSRGSLSPDIPRGSPVSSEHSICDLALSRTASIQDIPEDEGESGDIQPDNIAHYGLSRVATGSSGRSSVQDPRGRSHSRFSLRSIVHVVGAVKNRVRSRSPRAGLQSRPDEQETERGRTMTKGKAKVQVGPDGVRQVLPQIRVGESSSADGADDQNGEGWAVFPQGTYTYPIFFTIPNNSSPTMNAEHGSLIWKVKAEVRRPSTFTPKMTAQKEVVVVCLMIDDESEEIEGMDLEKQWEDQFRYRVQIAGRGFPIGGKVPLQLTIVPLAKIKVHSIAVCLDERTEYYTKAQSRARLDSVRHATLLMIRHNSLVDRHTRPILPLASGPDAFRKSPLYHFLNPGENESEMASSFMGPGPWTISHELKVPDSCTILHPSNQTKGSNVMANHTLRVILRVEKEEDSETIGRKKLYDIIIHIPILILSCRCTPEWLSLPCYHEALQSDDDEPEDSLTCPCRTRSKAKARAHSHIADSRLVLPDCFTSLPRSLSPSRESAVFSSDSLVTCRTHLYEQLASGLVSERGEAPPSYERLEVVHV